MENRVQNFAPSTRERIFLLRLCCSNTYAVSTLFVVIYVIELEIKWNQRKMQRPYHALAQVAATAVPSK
ncbi:hypothetical protein TNCT_287041 [Trichonephila clavata]|uniref:Uncharacterized protein n=1 Tax=Trichonephila clavata TaxID=2740835 RepID=A0A8X6M5A0_TRICU|nr:hypothetical protein TNCT_287041 [Trichonephila clavata]